MKVVCIGSGNVATHMANALKVNGADLIQVWSNHLQNAEVLAKAVGAQAIAGLNEIDPSADLYIIAVKDDFIAKIAGALKEVSGLVVHTSGATGLDVLSEVKNYGVLYPLQTFSKAKPVDFANVPLCIEAKDKELLGLVKKTALKLSPLVYEIDSRKRSILHLSAVFVCNFVNHLYVLGDKILADNSIDFEILHPLIMETALKVQSEDPFEVQTGPAVRNDEETINRHQELLESMPQLKEIYQTLSRSIKKTHQ